MWEYVGMARSEEGLKKAIAEIPKLREEFWSNVKIPGDGANVNVELEKAARVADFLELGELMAEMLLIAESLAVDTLEKSLRPLKTKLLGTMMTSVTSVHGSLKVLQQSLKNTWKN